ncbi:MAG: hypothetical protein RMJ43_03495 [Chloroherpetonaceae bacterium]|nr:hypothetical protein [Chthonomonadaceae bacterium]MDW8206876.1 hypothetical protein [Chloroherpetonaceae bacterium]
MSKSDIKPWHIVLLVVAAAVVLWRVAGYVGEQRRLSDVKYNPGTPYIQAPPGSIEAQREAEK